MNERVVNLFEQAGGSIRIDEVTKDEWTYTENLDVEKFAQSLIRECARVASGVDGKIVLDWFGLDYDGKEWVTEKHRTMELK